MIKPNKATILALIFLALASFASATYIDGFSQMRVVGDLSLNATTNLTFYMGQDQAMFISNESMVGIGTISPTQTLEVIGNISINDSSSAGHILIDSTNNAILFTGENGSIYQPVYGSDDGLVLYMPFSDDNATVGSKVVYDQSPYGNDGILNGDIVCNATLGKYGAGCYFDNNTKDYITINDNDNLDIGTNDLSVEVWVKPRTLQQGGIVVKRDTGDSAGVGYNIMMIASGAIRGGFNGNGGVNNVNTDSPNSLSINQWHHITFIAKRDSNTSLYINGELVNSKGISGDTGSLANTRNLDIGRNENGGYYYFNGTIDEVKIYKRALSAEEIRTHYLRGSGFQASGALTADKFRVVNTTGSRTFEVNQTHAKLAPGGVDRLTIDNGNVGIGITTPTHLLTVAGDLNVTGASYLGDIVIQADNLTVNEIVSRDGNISFFNSSRGEKMRILYDGKVGIGITTPTSKLAITSAIGTTIGTLATSGLHIGEAASNDRLSQISFGYSNNGANTNVPAAMGYVTTIDSTNTKGALYFATRDVVTDTAPSERMRIDANGNIGIATTSPSEKLEVIGNISVPGTLFVDNTSKRVGIGTITPNATLHVASSDQSITAETNVDDLIVTGDGSFAGMSIENGDGGINQLTFAFPTGNTRGRIAYYGPSYSTAARRDELEFHTNTTSRVSIKGNGFVGINDSSPSVLLDIGGGIRYNQATEYSPLYVGDALTAIKNIKPESGHDGDWVDVDHDTLPDQVRVDIKEKGWLKDKETGEEEREGKIKEEIQEALEEIEEETPTGFGIAAVAEPETKKQKIKNKIKSKDYNNAEEYIAQEYEQIEKDVPGRDVGKSIQLNTRAIQQLIEILETGEVTIQETRIVNNTLNQTAIAQAIIPEAVEDILANSTIIAGLNNRINNQTVTLAAIEEALLNSTIIANLNNRVNNQTVTPAAIEQILANSTIIAGLDNRIIDLESIVAADPTNPTVILDLQTKITELESKIALLESKLQLINGSVAVKLG